jgi:hypothetical protein
MDYYQSDIFKNTLKVVRKLYPEGPKQNSLWIRAEGKIDLLDLSGNGVAQWAAALYLIDLKYIENNNGISWKKLVDAMLSDHSGNKALLSLHKEIDMLSQKQIEPINIEENKEVLFFDFDWVCQYLMEGNCVLVLGPELASINIEGVKMPLLKHFSSSLEKELSKKAEGKTNHDTERQYDLSYVALCLSQTIMGAYRTMALKRRMRKFYETHCIENTPIPEVYSLLAKLPFHLVINTAPDHFMQQAFEKEKKGSTFFHYDYHKNKNNSAKIPENDKQNPIVYNLFGDFSNEKSLVLTKEDELDFINGILQDVSRLPDAITKQLNKDKIYLFLGFDTQTWHLPLLLRTLLPFGNDSAFYLEPKPQEKQIWSRLFYEQSFNFNFIAQDYRDYVQKLWKSFNKLEKDYS